MEAQKRLAALIIVVFSVLTGGGWLLSNSAYHDQQNYGFLHSQGEQLVVNFGTHFVWLDADGTEVAVTDFSQAGIVPVGDFLAMSDGRLLVYHQPQAPGLLTHLRQFLRLRDAGFAPAVEGEGFYRCSPAPLRCEPFGHGLPRMQRSFRLARDPDSGQIYLVHTGAFEVWQLTAAGEQVSVSNADQFHFPNQLIAVNDQLWLADTNHHRIVQLAAGENFPQELASVPVALAAPYRWPHQLVWDQAAARFLVLLGDNGMANGRLVSVTGGQVRELDGVQAQDPMALHLQQATLWMTDFNAGALHRYALEDNRVSRLPDASSPTLTRLEAGRASQQASARQWQWFCGLAFVLVVMGGFGAAWRLEKQQTLEALTRWRGQVPQRLLSATPEAIDPGATVWIDNDRVKLLRWRMPASVLVAAVFVCGLALASMRLNASLADPFVPLFAMLCLMLVPMHLLWLWLLSYQAGQRLGVTESGVILSAPGLPFVRARSVAVRFNEVQFNAHFLQAADLVLMLGNTRVPVFDQTQLARYLWPRLTASSALSPKTLNRWLFTHGHPIAWLPVVVAVLVMVVGLGFAGFKAVN